MRTHLHASQDDQHSYVLAGQRVGIKEFWIVSFMHYDLGFFDQVTCRLEPVGNPFEPKVLPMSPAV